MTCADELAAVQREIDQLRARLALVQSAIAAYRAATPSTQQNVSSAASTTTAAPVTQPTTQPQEERRAGDGEMAQYAALLRDIEDMEAQLDKLEAR